MSTAVSGSNGIAHNVNPTGAQAPAVGGSTPFSNGQAINPPTGNQPKGSPAVFAQTRAAREADMRAGRYKSQPR